MYKNIKKITGILLVLAMLLVQTLACLPFSAAAAEQSAAVSTASATQSIQDGVTLHCWNWSFANIEANLDKIAAAGYTAIQTSPIQPLKESTKESWSTYGNHWWVTYQPTEFKINTLSSNALGTKTQFKSMCDAAEKKGIKVIVDVVANHLANSTSNNISSAVPSYLRTNTAYWHDTSRNTNDWWNRWEVTQLCLAGLPDLNTSNKDIQNYVLTFLKECVDAGADGFRFDAAKHIETPEDSNCASDFWPTVVNGIKAYKSDIYIYGEMLDDTGGVSFNAYTKYMSITDNRWSDKVRENVINSGNAGNFYSGYDNGVSADKLVLWAESHDTYGNKGGASMYDSTQNINKTWALVAARADAMSLYLARPDSFDIKLGAASTNTGWNWTEVAAVNKFHNDFVGQSEYVANEGGFAYVERGNSGVVIVNVGSSSGSVNVKANRMANGTYVDQISGNKFTVSNGRITGNITNSCGYAVVYNACSHSWSTTTTTAATCTTEGSSKSTCTKCGEVKTEVIPAKGHSFSNDKCTVCGAAKPADHVLYFTNNGTWSNVNIYYWSDANDAMVTWPGKAMTSVGSNVYTYTVPADAQYVIFNNGSAQTDDLTIPSNYDYYSNGKWTNYSTNACSHASHNTSGVCTSCGVNVGHTYVNNKCTVCGDTKPTESLSTDYYLIGYINGADYGCEGDAANMGDYKFVDGKLKVTFKSDSYVFLKTANNAKWYMTNGWLGTDVTSATLYNTSSLGSTADKLYVPGGVEWEFTVVENSDGTVTLSYAEPGCEHSYTSKVTTAATCTKAGVKTFTCSKCGDSYTESIPATGHSYTSKVTTAATCDADGLKTFTCSGCGDSYTEVIPSSGHSYVGGVCTNCGAADPNACEEHTWVYKFENQVHTFTCSECGKVVTGAAAAGEKKFAMTGASPVLKDDIVIKVSVRVPAGFTNVYAVFNFHGEDLVYNAPVENGTAVFAFDKICPMYVGDNFKTTIYATFQGEQVSICRESYSMLEYAVSQLNKTNISANLRTALSDLLVYAEKAQLYFDWNTENLVTEGLDAVMTPTTYVGPTAEQNKQALVGDKSSVVDFRGATVMLQSKIVLRYSIKTADPYAQTYKITVAGATYELTGDDLVLQSETATDMYYLYFDVLKATQFDETIVCGFYDGETQIGRSAEYSVNTYVYQSIGKAEGELKDVLMALYNYGEAARNI